MKGGKINRLRVTFLEKFFLPVKRKLYTEALYTIINTIHIVFGMFLVINDTEDSENR